MKLTIDAKVLADGIGAVADAVANRTTNPVLATVKLAVADGVATVTATDTEVAVKRTIGSGGESDGAVLLDPKRTVQWLKEQTGEVAVAGKGDEVTVSQGRKKLSLPVLDVDGFPEFSTGAVGGVSVVVGYEVLATMIDRVRLAADKKEGARWATTGVRFETGGGQLVLVATDTKRLAVATCAADADAGEAIVPLKAVNLVAKNGPGDAPEVTVTLAKNAATFATDSWTVHTRLVEGKFPPYRQIVPKKLDHAVLVPVGAFTAAVREAAVATDDHSKRVEFHFRDGECEMRATGDNGESRSVAELATFEGDVELAMDPNYVLDTLKPFDKGDTVTVRFTSADKPVLFHVGDHYTALVMPLGEREG